MPMMAKLSSAEGLICFYSFVLGGLRFSVISFSFYFCTSTLRMSPSSAIIICHSNMASMYLSETLTGTVSKTKLGVPRSGDTTAVVLSSILVFSFLCPLIWGDSLWKVSYVGVSLLMFVCALLGGLIHCLKHIFINEYDLPKDQNRYLNMKFFVVELEYMGKTIGGFLAMGTVMEEPSITFAGSCWMGFGILQLFTAIAGLKLFRTQKDNRNIIKEFIKHSFLAMKAQLSNRRNQSENFSADDEERIKIVHSVLPLYVPVIILIGLKDLKYSRYTWQTMHLNMEIFDSSYNPQKILMIYPLTVAVCLPVYHYAVHPLLKKTMTLKLRTTTRAIVSFYFMAISLAFATVLECRIELSQNTEHKNKTVSAVEVFNFLPCTAVLSSTCAGPAPQEVPSLDMSTMRCPVHYDYNAILVQGICRVSNVTRYFEMTVVLNKHQDVRIAMGFDLRHADKHNYDHKILPVFFQHLHYTNMEVPELPKLSIIFNLVQDHSVRIVPAMKTSNGWVPCGPDAFERELKQTHTSRIALVELAKDGWYAIVIDNNMAQRLHYQSWKSYAIMISQTHPQEDVVVRIINVRHKPSQHVLYQLPQVISSALAEMMIEAPGFVFGRKKVPLQWNEFITVVWTFSSFLGNLIIIVGGFASHIERNLTAFLIGSACSIVAIALISVFLLDYYKADYAEE